MCEGLVYVIEFDMRELDEFLIDTFDNTELPYRVGLIRVGYVLIDGSGYTSGNGFFMTNRQHFSSRRFQYCGYHTGDGSDD